MKKIILAILLMSVFVIAGCSKQNQQQTAQLPDSQINPEQQQVCTQMWICADENTKAYRSSDCTFEQATECPAGCENGNCKQAEEQKKEASSEPTEVNAASAAQPAESDNAKSCNFGWACLDSKRIGYRYSDCHFANVEECQYGCKDDNCVRTAPPEEKKEEIFSLKEGTAKIRDLGQWYSDFSKNQIMIKEASDNDVKIILYAKSVSKDYFKAESPSSSLWIIKKGIKDASRQDCIVESIQSTSYAILRSGQTLCIQTIEKDMALIGGYWLNYPDEKTELTWKYYR